MKCNKCGTENGYYRSETKEWVCRKCGIVTTIKNELESEPQKEGVL